MNKKVTKKEEDMWNILLNAVVTLVTPKVVDTLETFIKDAVDILKEESIEVIEEFEKVSILDELEKLFTTTEDAPVIPPTKKIHNRKSPDHHKITVAEYQYIVTAYTWFNEYNVNFFAAGKKYQQPVLINTLNRILGLNKSATPYRNVWSTSGKTLESMCPDIPPTFDATHKTFIGVLTDEGTKFAKTISTS